MTVITITIMLQDEVTQYRMYHSYKLRKKDCWKVIAVCVLVQPPVNYTVGGKPEKWEESEIEDRGEDIFKGKIHKWSDVKHVILQETNVSVCKPD